MNDGIMLLHYYANNFTPSNGIMKQHKIQFEVLNVYVTYMTNGLILVPISWVSSRRSKVEKYVFSWRGLASSLGVVSVRVIVLIIHLTYSRLSAVRKSFGF